MKNTAIHILASSTTAMGQDSLLHAAVLCTIKPGHSPGCFHRRLFFWCAPALGPETSLFVPTGPGGRSRAGLTAKKLAGLSWKPTVSTGMTGQSSVLQRPRISRPACGGRSGRRAAPSLPAACRAAIDTLVSQAYLGMWVTPNECHTTTSLLATGRSCNAGVKVQCGLSHRWIPHSCILCTEGGVNVRSMSREVRDASNQRVSRVETACTADI